MSYAPAMRQVGQRTVSAQQHKRLTTSTKSSGWRGRLEMPTGLATRRSTRATNISVMGISHRQSTLSTFPFSALPVLPTTGER